MLYNPCSEIVLFLKQYVINTHTTPSYPALVSSNHVLYQIIIYFRVEREGEEGKEGGEAGQEEREKEGVWECVPGKTANYYCMAWLVPSRIPGGKPCGCDY